MNSTDHKTIKGLKTLHGREISRPNKVAARKGGGIAKKARLELEQKTGKPVVSGNNFLPPGKKTLTRAKKK